jgi:NAD(P)H-dependent FMN reductase
MSLIQLNHRQVASDHAGPHVELLSTSTSPASVSRRLLAAFQSALELQGATTRFTDTENLPPAFPGSGPVPTEYDELAERIARAHGVAIAYGVHGYSFPGATKSVVDLLGEAFASKPVVFLTAAGSIRSHLVVGQLAQSLVLEHGSIWYPATIQVTVESLEEDETSVRLESLAAGYIDFVSKLAAVDRG